jgi:hypothetical protein
MLARHLRADVAYEPHVTVGSCDDRADCERMAREFNRLWSPSSAHIDGLVLLDVDGPRARELGVFALAGANRVAGA